MDVKEYIQSFAEKDCACGKSHKIATPNVIVKKGALNMIPDLLREYGGRKVFILADKNTFSAAGQSVVRILQDSGVEYSKYVFQKDKIEPDENAVGSAVMHFDNACDIVVAIGSGVINDIGKILAATANLPYFIVGTAPSMDGYASATSSMAMDGLKVSLPSKCADVIIGDIDVLKNAPMHTLQAGLGDMLAKYVSIAEWRIAHEITGEYYCERVADLIRVALKRCVSNAQGLLKREEEAIKAVFEGLVLGGVAMAFAGVSRPASGVEHYFSHVWDMRGLEFNLNVDLHGIQCAVATNIVAGLYEKVLSVVPNKERAIFYARAFDYSKWSKELLAFLGSGAKTMIEQEKRERKYSVEKHAKRIDVIIEKWDLICQIIREEIPTQKEIERILDIIGAPKTTAEIGICCDINTTLKATKDIRDKYVLSRLLWDLGIIDEIL
ncbi:MAG: sn-glycerol-1-phosphate dehydrogenase [Clostridia bacterium]|nr:sn-glycerol-1-phosphate dehydrogenase [Clostridia bacterium]